jgi:bifunctional non-homologous end joining protein LigD
MNGND